LEKELLKLIAETKKYFKKTFHKKNIQATSFSPSSIVLLGDHTHYNDGILVLATIDLFSVACASVNDDENINITIKSRNSSTTDDKDMESELSWKCGNLFIGPLLKLLRDRGFIKSGFSLFLNSNIPQSIGMGFVASYQISFVSALNQLFGLGLSHENIKQLCIEAERNYLGKMANPAHYFAILNGSKNHWIKVDLRFLTFEKIFDIENDHQLIVFDNLLEIPNATEICSKRIEECQVGVQALRLYIWGIKNLRDVTLDFLSRHLHMLPRIIYQRILFTVQEKTRAESSLAILRNNEYKLFGELMFQSHNGLRNDYEIGNERIDFIVNLCSKNKTIIGAKVVSCSSIESVVCLSKKKKSTKLCNDICETYNKKYGIPLFKYKFNLSDGILNL